MYEAYRHDREKAEREKAEREKAEKKARGGKLYAVLPWRSDARYDGSQVIRSIVDQPPQP